MIRRKLLISYTLALGFSILAFSSCTKIEKKDALFQASTISALSQGMYHGDMSFQELNKYGDFGLGTFNDLDGEMIILDGVFYQAKTDGYLYPVSLQETKTPFSEVTFFRSNLTKTVTRQMTQTELKEMITGLLRSKNIFYAIRIVGHFPYIKIRSVPAQKRPYPKLDDVVKDQAVFEFHQAEGTIVGFWCPEYVKKVNVPGYHFHFISRDKKRGGHVLDFIITNSTIDIDEKTSLDVVLPETEDFYMIDTSEESQNLAEK
ncbi:MAG: acetolactate decarboxylase [Candidatus Omnitrophota bacterium]